MKSLHEPLLRPVPLKELRPTQMTIGLREVERKRNAWRERADRDGNEYLGHHMIPVVIGPRETLWMIDHHHLARALHDEGVAHVLVSTIANLSRLGRQEFRTFMENRNWLHPFDPNGERRAPAELPKRIADLKDDPFRSLAGALRESGGFAKDLTPYTEFLWADFLRRRVGGKKVERNFEQAVAKALKLAHSPAARHLPGWCGSE